MACVRCCEIDLIYSILQSGIRAFALLEYALHAVRQGQNTMGLRHMTTCGLTIDSIRLEDWRLPCALYSAPRMRGWTFWDLIVAF